jgi:Xaa-Pro aminopeptidase
MANRSSLSKLLGLILGALLLSLALLFPLAPTRTSADDDRLAGIPRSEYKARRQRLMERGKDGIIVLLGARLEDLTDIRLFKQKNNFMYLTGVETPNSFLILIPEGVYPGKPAQEILFIPSRNPNQERWTGAQVAPGPDGEQAFGFQEVAPAETFYSRLFQMLASPPFKGQLPGQQFQPKVHVIAAPLAIATTTREREFMDVLLRTAPYVPIFSFQSEIYELRKVKSEAELATLRKAIDITAEGMRAATAAIKPGAYEYEVQAAIESTFLRRGADRLGFSSIIGSGSNSTVIHSNRNRKMIESGDLVLVDIGAEYNYYTGDLTRTFPASGKFTPRQREIYQLVLDAQRAAEKEFKPGKTTIYEIEEFVKSFFKKSPVRDKQGNPVDKYFIHGIGHGLGMDVHDLGDLSKPMMPGTVFTIEPGIYLPDESLGVRIEDDYLVTETGLLKLSAGLPSDAGEIERMISSKTTAASEKPAVNLKGQKQR